MSRHGKIARLPHAVREELNTRLHDGVPGTSLLPWLNRLPEVQAVLAAHFGGRPINAPNLTGWRQGGYADWLCRHEARSCLTPLPAGYPALETPVTLALGRCLQHFISSPPGDPTQLPALLELSRELTRLRRCALAERGPRAAFRSLTPESAPAAPQLLRILLSGSTHGSTPPSPAPTPLPSQILPHGRTH